MRGNFNILPVSGIRGISASANIVRKSFQTVAVEMRLTRENCATHPSFITNQQLKALQERGLAFFGGYLDNAQVGFVAVEQADPELYYMEKLAILPANRHQGYGRNLVEFVFGYVNSQSGKKISIGVIDEQAVLKGWYKNLGFKETLIKRFPHLPFTVCYMEIEL